MKTQTSARGDLSNLERYKKDLKDLIQDGERLHNAIQLECYPDRVHEAARKMGDAAEEMISKLAPFGESYQQWYSESKVLIRQLLPDRLDDFVRQYEKPKTRKAVTYESYRIEDYLQRLTVTRGGAYKEVVVGPEAAIPPFRQQLNILKSVERRFESSLFDIKQLAQADLFDSELGAASTLAENGFVRAAGALAGVVLEKHLAQTCEMRTLTTRKKNPTISVYNDLLKEGGVLDIPEWRFVQHLADIRNLCDHAKDDPPTSEQVNDLIRGVSKVVKTVF